MLIRLAVLGALGYAGYKFYLHNADQDGQQSENGHPGIALAGGPLSNQASVQHSADLPPQAAPSATPPT